MAAVLVADANEILARLGLEPVALGNLCRANGVSRLEVFNSAVRADFDPATSDLDLVVEIEAPTCGAYAERCFALEEGLERLTGRAVDLLTAGALVVHDRFGSAFTARSRASRVNLW